MLNAVKRININHSIASGALRASVHRTALIARSVRGLHCGSVRCSTRRSLNLPRFSFNYIASPYEAYLIWDLLAPIPYLSAI